MASASTWPLSVKPHSTAERAPPAWPAVLVFVLLLAALSTLCWLTRAHGLVSADALAMTAKLYVLRDAAGFRLEYLGFEYPQATTYLGALLAALPGVHAEAVPYVIDLVAVSLLGASAWRDIGQRHGPAWASLLVLLLFAHPYLWWAATSGQQQGLGLFLLYRLLRVFGDVAGKPEPMTYMRLGGWLCALLFVDERGMFVVLALAPWLILVAPREVLQRSPLAFYLVTYIPVVFAGLGWIYLNWLFLRDGFAFLSDPGSSFRGAFSASAYLPWLEEAGGRFWYPAGVTLLAGLMTVPVLVFSPLVARMRGQFDGIAAAGMVVTAAALATYWRFAAQPADFILLLLPVGIVVMRAVARPMLAGVALAALLGIGGGWMTLAYRASPSVTEWITALARPVTPAFEEERTLGQWLAREPMPTLIDDRAAFAVIAGYGNADEFILPFSQRFKLALLSPARTPPQIVVADPRSEAGSRDTVSLRFPGLWEHGRPDYFLVHEQGPYRVWRRAP
jgi:membrane protein XagC